MFAGTTCVIALEEMGKNLDFALAILNGAVGDYLVRTGNGLATMLTFVDSGQPLEPETTAFREAYPQATSRVVVLVHGLMCTETAWEFPDGDDFGQRLSREFGWTPLYVRYNSGRAIADNGADFAALLESLVANYPVPIEEILLLGYSMGGLVIRSACHVASLQSQPWLSKVKRALYVGTPHLGAPTERVGRVVTKVLGKIPNPYTRLAAELANLRSAGVKDLGDADIRHEDRARWSPQLSIRDPRHPVPLLPSIQHYLIAGALWSEPWLAMLFGDTMVPLASSSDGAIVDTASMAFPPSHVQIVHGFAHIDLPRRPEIYEHLRAWCGELQ